MSTRNSVRDGRKAQCYLLVKDATKVAAGSLVAGHFYVTTKKGASSALPAYPLNKAFYCKEAATVAADDEVFELKAFFMGFANSKSLSSEKTTTDVTCDKDESNNYTTDGSVNVSGTISGYDLIGDEHSAIEQIRTRFNDTVDDTGEEVVVNEAQTTIKDMVVFIWDAFNAKTGDIIAMDFVPCFLTTQNRDASYQAGQSFNIDIQGCDSDDNGIGRGYLTTIWAGVVADQPVA